MNGQGRHAAHGRSSPYIWLVGWDHKAHAFPQPLGELSSVSACETIARTSGLTEPTADDPWCRPCLHVLGHELTTHPTTPTASERPERSPTPPYLPGPGRMPETANPSNTRRDPV